MRDDSLYVPLHQGIWSSPKFRRTVRALGVRPVELMGHLAALWHHCLQHCPDGTLDGYEDEDVADAAMWDEDPGELVAVLVAKGWLDEDDESGLSVHDWNEYAGRGLNLRKRERERKREQRSRRRKGQSADVPRQSVTHPDVSQGCPRDVPGTHEDTSGTETDGNGTEADVSRLSHAERDRERDRNRSTHTPGANPRRDQSQDGTADPLGPRVPVAVAPDPPAVPSPASIAWCQRVATKAGGLTTAWQDVWDVNPDLVRLQDKPGFAECVERQPDSKLGRTMTSGIGYLNTMVRNWEPETATKKRPGRGRRGTVGDQSHICAEPPELRGQPRVVGTPAPSLDEELAEAEAARRLKAGGAA